MSESFEININADEWLDITSKEELLQNELNRVKNDLETRSMELLESNVTIDLLKGHKTLLENERETLTEELARTNNEVARVAKELQESLEQKESLKLELASMRDAADRREKSLEQSLSECKQELEHTHTQVGQLHQNLSAFKKDQEAERREATGTIEHLTKLVEKLGANIRSLEASNKMQQESLVQTRQELHESQAREKALRGEISRQKNQHEQVTRDLKMSSGDLSTVSLLAENLKSKNSALVRSMATMQKLLNDTKAEFSQSTTREISLKAELEKIKSDAACAKMKYEESVAKNTAAIQASAERIAELEACVQDFKGKCAVLSADKETLLVQLSEKTELCKDLQEKNVCLKEDVKQHSLGMKVVNESIKCVLAREAALKEELENQRVSFNNRLAEIRAILGVSAIAEIRSEIKTVARKYEKERARCSVGKAQPMRVPLIVDVGKFD